MYKLELKSSHEVIDTVDVVNIESIFCGKPTDPDILTVVMKDGKRLYCDEVCPVDSLQKEPVSEDLEDASRNYADDEEYGDDIYFAIKAAFKAGAKWQKTNLWKPADGDDLPIIDREVVVLIKYNTQRNINDEEYPTYIVGFGHRPNPDGWDGKNIDTNEVTHYTPKLYDKGGWNAPDIVYWLDIELPKEIKL